MASQRAYARMHGAPYTKSIDRDQRSKRSAAIQRARQIRDTMAAANVAFRPGGWKRTTPQAVLQERKVIDIVSGTYNFQTPATPPTPILLNGCIAGSQNYNRIGRKINNRSIQVRGWINSVTTGAAADDQLCRMLIVYDKQSNGAAPTWANVIQSQDITGATSSTSSDMVNLDNRDRFIVLRDRCYAMSFQSSTATQAVQGSHTVCMVEEYFKINLETIFNAGTAGTVGDITTGAIHVFFCGSNASTIYSFIGSFRTRFEDM